MRLAPPAAFMLHPVGHTSQWRQENANLSALPLPADCGVQACFWTVREVKRSRSWCLLKPMHLQFCCLPQFTGAYTFQLVHVGRASGRMNGLQTKLEVFGCHFVD